MTFDEVVHEVYGVPAAEFIAARKRAAHAASAQGDRELAKRITALKKPSAAAAAVNALARANDDRLAELARMHDEFSDAQDDGDRNAMQRLGARRRALIAGLTDRARELIQSQGGSVSAAAADEVGATLLAAVADTTAAKALASGCLVRALTANGVDRADIDDAVALPIAGLRPLPRSGSEKRATAKSSEEKDAQKKARAGLKDAMRAATRANADLERSDAAHRRAAQRQEKLQAERDELNERLIDLDAAIEAADGELENLAAQQEDAARAAEAAEEAVAAARRRVSPNDR